MKKEKKIAERLKNSFQNVIECGVGWWGEEKRLKKKNQIVNIMRNLEISWVRRGVSWQRIIPRVRIKQEKQF